MALLERGDFLDTLAEYAREARDGSGRLVFVVGESGIGNTALLEAFASGMDDSGTTRSRPTMPSGWCSATWRRSGRLGGNNG